MSRTPRKFIVDSFPDKGPVFLNPEASHHLIHVLRLKPGEICRLADREGREAEAEVSGLLLDGRARLLLKSVPRKVIAPSNLIVAQALPQKAIMDRLVEKAGELGVEELIPMRTAYTQLDPDEGKKEKMQARWLRVAEAAAKQSGNPPVNVRPVVNFSEALGQLKGQGPLYLAHPDAAQTWSVGLVKDKKPGAGDKKICLLIGPEGGFSDLEIRQAGQCGARLFSLPGGILRIETAFVSVVSLFRYALEA